VKTVVDDEHVDLLMQSIRKSVVANRQRSENNDVADGSVEYNSPPPSGDAKRLRRSSYKDLTMASMLSPCVMSIPLPPSSDDRRKSSQWIIKDELNSDTRREADVNVTDAARMHDLGSLTGFDTAPCAVVVKTQRGRLYITVSRLFCLGYGLSLGHVALCSLRTVKQVAG
jgi:hypothetical protein